MPVGFHLIRPLKRPISSSSVQGSVIARWSAWAWSSEGVGEGAVGGSVGLVVLVGRGEVVVERRVFLRGGIVDGGVFFGG